MLKKVLTMFSLLLIFSITGCKDVRPVPEQATASNQPPAETEPPAEVGTQELTPVTQEETTPAPESTGAENKTPAKSREQRMYERMVRNREASLALKDRLGIKAPQGQLPMRVVLDDDGNYTELACQRMTVTDKMVEFVADLDSHMQSLRFQNCVITDTQVGRLAKLKFLKRLEISSAPITGTCLVILEGFDKLEKLNLSGDLNLSLDQLPELPALTELSLTGSKNISDASVPKLGMLKGLKELTLYDTKITDAGAAQLKELLPDCKISR